MKRLIAITVLAFAVSQPPIADAAPRPKIWVCHWSEDDLAYNLIHISERGWERGHSRNHELDFVTDTNDNAVNEDTVCADVAPTPN